MSHSRDSSLFHTLEESPWWVSMLLAGIVYLCLRFIPWLFATDGKLTTPVNGLQAHAALLALIFLLPALFSWLAASERKRTAAWQSALASLRKLSFPSFQALCAQAFRARGYAVENIEGIHGGGSIDLRLSKAGEISLVTCRQWRNYKIGVPELIELYQQLDASKADRGIYIASGSYTSDALHFALGKPLVLIDAAALLDLVGTTGSDGEDIRRAFQQAHAVSPSPPPRCPECGATMVPRTAKRGRYFGSPFWSCSNFPSCRGVREP